MRTEERRYMQIHKKRGRTSMKNLNLQSKIETIIVKSKDFNGKKKTGNCIIQE